MLLDRGVDVLSRPGIAELAIEHGAAEPPLAPTRTEMLELVGAAGS